MLAGCQGGDAVDQPPAETAAPEPPAAIDPAAAGAELAGLYADLCLERFPDEAAFAEGVELRRLVALPPRAARQILREDDPERQPEGRAWQQETAAGDPTVVTLEDAPGRACAVRRSYDATPDFQRPYQQTVRSWIAGRGLGRLVALAGSFQNGPKVTTYAVIEVERQDGKPAQSFSSLVTALRNGKTEVRLVHELPRP